MTTRPTVRCDDSCVALKQNGCVLGEAVKLWGLSHRSAAACKRWCSPMFEVPSDSMPICPLLRSKTSWNFLLQWDNPAYPPPTTSSPDYWQPSHPRTSSNGTFPAKSFQMSLLRYKWLFSLTSTPTRLYKPINIVYAHLTFQCDHFHLVSTKTALGHNLLRAQMLFILCFPKVMYTVNA